MPPVFWIKLGLSFLVGGIWITLSTLAAERFGSKIGGVIGGFPSTILVALFFIGLTQTPADASAATTIVPLAMGLNGIFLLTFLLLIRRGLLIGLGGGLLAWFGLAAPLIRVNSSLFWLNVLIWLVLIIGFYFLAEKIMEIPSREGSRLHYSPQQILQRAIGGGAVIAFAVLMGKLGGPAYGGVFASFPALFLSTLVITHQTGGAEFSRAMAKALLVSGIFNVAFYGIAVRYTYIRFGLYGGTVAAIFCSCCAAYLIFQFLKAKVS
jgi:uncharacterized membrane protein (GlpM family)